MRHRNYCDIIEILDEREAQAELAVINNVTQSTYGGGKLVSLNFTLEQGAKVIDVKAWAALFPNLFLRLFHLFCLLFKNRVRQWNKVADCIEIALIDIFAAPNVETFNLILKSQLIVIYFDRVLRDLAQVVRVFPKLSLCYVKLMKRFVNSFIVPIISFVAELEEIALRTDELHQDIIIIFCFLYREHSRAPICMTRAHNHVDVSFFSKCLPDFVFLMGIIRSLV